MRRLTRTPVLAVLLITLGVVCISCSTACAQGGDVAEPASSAVDPHVAKTELDDILSQPEYNRQFQQNWMQDIWPKIAEWLRSFAERFRSPFGARVGRTASIVFASIVLIGFAGLVWLLIRNVGGGRRRSVSDSGRLLQEASMLPSSAPLIEESRRLAGNGDYRGAFRCVYLACISYLDENGALRFERSRTNWEYLRELQDGGHTRSHQLLQPLTLDFDRTFYGRQTCTEDNYRGAVDVYRAIAAEAAA